MSKNSDSEYELDESIVESQESPIDDAMEEEPVVSPPAPPSTEKLEEQARKEEKKRAAAQKRAIMEANQLKLDKLPKKSKPVSRRNLDPEKEAEKTGAKNVNEDEDAELQSAMKLEAECVGLVGEARARCAEIREKREETRNQGHRVDWATDLMNTNTYALEIKQYKSLEEALNSNIDEKMTAAANFPKTLGPAAAIAKTDDGKITVYQISEEAFNRFAPEARKVLASYVERAAVYERSVPKVNVGAVYTKLSGPIDLRKGRILSRYFPIIIKLDGPKQMAMVQKAAETTLHVKRGREETTPDELGDLLSGYNVDSQQDEDERKSSKKGRTITPREELEEFKAPTESFNFAPASVPPSAEAKEEESKPFSFSASSFSLGKKDGGKKYKKSKKTKKMKRLVRKPRK